MLCTKLAARISTEIILPHLDGEILPGYAHRGVIPLRRGWNHGRRLQRTSPVVEGKLNRFPLNSRYPSNVGEFRAVNFEGRSNCDWPTVVPGK